MIDSWAWIEYFKGTGQGQQAAEYIDGDDEIVVSSVNIAEVYRFLLANKKEEADRLIQFLKQRSFVIDLTAELAQEAARIKHHKKHGMADAMVLATAQAHHSLVVTGDDDFKKEANVIYIGD